MISGEQFDLQPLYLAQGDRLASPSSPLSLSDLDLVVQGLYFYVISGEPLDLQHSYLAQGDTLAGPSSPLIWSNLDLIVQGQSFVGDTLRTVSPTAFIFGTGGHIGELFRSINFDWP